MYRCHVFQNLERYMMTKDTILLTFCDNSYSIVTMKRLSMKNYYLEVINDAILIKSMIKNTNCILYELNISSIQLSKCLLILSFAEYQCLCLKTFLTHLNKILNPKELIEINTNSRYTSLTMRNTINSSCFSCIDRKLCATRTS